AGVPTLAKVAPAGLVPAPLAGLGPENWTWVGPGNVGGRTRGIVGHPTDPKRLWIGSAGGGGWASIQSGKSWKPVDDFMASLAIGCLAMDPTDPKVIYAGTGEGFGNEDAIQGAGIFRTVDGTTWTQLTATATPDFVAVTRIALSSDGAVALAT